MAKLQSAENWLVALLNTQTVAGIPAGDAPELVFGYLFGDFVQGLDGLAMAMAAGVVWFLCWSLIALRLDRAGHWKSALACFAVGYEATWAWLIIMYMASGRSALFVLVLPMFGWSFTVVSALTALLFWKHGVKKIVFGLPGLLINFAEKRGWLLYIRVPLAKSDYSVATIER